jgi:TRAP-type C4-dicarboxylate transport system permease small subunit
MLAIVLLVLAIIIAVYMVIVRPILKTQPVFSEAFKAEASFLDKVRAKVVGWRTRIAARLTMLAGLFVGLYDQALPIITGQDWTPLTAKVPAWALPVSMVGVGLLFAYLRRITGNPPQIVTQKDDFGVAKVVDVIKPAS